MTVGVAFHLTRDERERSRRETFSEERFDLFYRYMASLPEFEQTLKPGKPFKCQHYVYALLSPMEAFYCRWSLSGD